MTASPLMQRGEETWLHAPAPPWGRQSHCWAASGTRLPGPSARGSPHYILKHHGSSAAGPWYSSCQLHGSSCPSRVPSPPRLASRLPALDDDHPPFSPAAGGWQSRGRSPTSLPGPTPASRAQCPMLSALPLCHQQGDQNGDTYRGARGTNSSSSTRETSSTLHKVGREGISPTALLATDLYYKLCPKRCPAHGVRVRGRKGVLVAP